MVPGLRARPREQCPRQLPRGVQGDITRCFVALGLEPPPGPALAADLAHLKQAFPELSVPPPGNLHLTLAFLGELDSAGVEMARTAVVAARGRSQGWTVRWGRPGGFPSLRRARVVWLGLEDPGPTAGAQAILAAHLGAVGLPVEEREFRPHLTLARVRRELRNPRVAELEAALNGFARPPAATVVSMVLYSSRMGTGRGRVYEEVEVARLG